MERQRITLALISVTLVVLAVPGTGSAQKAQTADSEVESQPEPLTVAQSDEEVDQESEFASVTEELEEDAGHESAERRQFGGPNAVERQLEEDAEPKTPAFRFDNLSRRLESYFNFKQRTQEQRGLSFGADYSAVYLNASDSLGDDDAGGGMIRFYGVWDLVGRGTQDSGALVYKFEHRHRYTDIAPSGFGFNLGYVGLMTPPFSNQGLRATNLYWRQRGGNGGYTWIAGFLDATDYVDVYALASPWTGFFNFAFSTGGATIAVPNDATLGVAGAAMLTDQVYIIGGLVDANSDPTHPFDGFDTFFDDSEFFTNVELGVTTSKGRIYVDNYHVTVWHKDRQQVAGVPQGWGVNLSLSRLLNDKWMPFLRVGYADDGGTLLEKSVSVGFGYQPATERDYFGVGFNWGEPNENTFVPGLSDQYSFEVFYRLQFSEQFAITPDIQLLINPALNPAEDKIWLFGLRARMVL